MTPGEYEHATSCSLQDIFFKVVDAFKISKLAMQKHYNKNLCFTDYTPGQQVWLKVKHYKTGENRKLAPRRDGSWTIVNKLPNVVNLTIRNLQHEQKVVHHDRIVPVIKNEFINAPERRNPSDNSDHASSTSVEADYSYSSDSGSNASSHNGDINEQSDDSMQEEDAPPRNHPRRQRRARILPGTIPWNALDL